MVVPFGVGVGDFIAVAKLTKDIVAELKNDSEAVSHYQHLVVELESLDSALSRINEIKPGQHELIYLEAIRAAVVACERPLDAFLAKLKKYDSTMGTWNTGEKRFEGIGRRVQYGFDIWGDVPELRTALASHIATITILMLAQTMTSLSAAETDRAEISNRISNATLILQQVNNKQRETNSDLKTHKEALDTLKATIDQSNDLSRNVSDVADNALAVLQKAVEQSYETNSEVRSELRSLRKSGEKSQPLTTEEVAKSIRKPEAKLHDERNGQDEEDIRTLQKEMSHLRAEIDRVSEHISVPSRIQEIGKPSILETTSKVLNLVLSGIMAASVWTLMNQSQEIATLSRMLIENRNVTSGPPLGYGSTGNVYHRAPNQPSSFDRTSSESDDDELPAPPDIREVRRISDPLGPVKIISPDIEAKEGTTFIVRIENLDPVFDGHIDRFPENLVWGPPDPPKGLRTGEAILFRWSGGFMESISEPNLGLSTTDSKLEQYSVASVIPKNQDKELLAVDFDAGRQVVLDASDGRKKRWRSLSFHHERLPLRRSASNVMPPDRYPANLKSKRYYTYVEFNHADGYNRTAARMPEHIVPQLLQKSYNNRKFLMDRENAGLVGSLPLLIALAAFSAPREHTNDVLLSSIRPGRWVPHDNWCGRENTHRGMVVTVYYDPENPAGSNEESLDRLQDGHDGPFYGPERPEQESSTESMATQLGFDKGARILEGYDQDL